MNLAELSVRDLRDPVGVVGSVILEGDESDSHKGVGQCVLG